ncbi:MAG: DUF1080 domain-containing protein [Gemmataceae bacterium]
MRILALMVSALVLVLQPAASDAGKDKGVKKETKKKEVWTDPEDASIPIDFYLQGEYLGKSKEGTVGAQVIALGNGEFQAVIYPGGLPGSGWDGKNRSLMQGCLGDDGVVFSPATGKRRYIAQKPEEFSATAKFPPVGQQDHSGKLTKGVLVIKGKDGASVKLASIARKSNTMGLKAPPGAVVLFDGKDASAWNRGRVDKGVLNTDGSDIVTKKKFNNYTAHVEFLLPFRPDARGQGRGNSGFYQVDHYEVQILDSFGLEGKDNECGGIYTKKTPILNMCLPPLQWQTYDVDFTNAVADASGKKVKNARVTVRLNGEVIHDNVEITGPTGGGRSEPEATPGPIKLQGHGNPLQFRNIWIVEKK